MGTGHIGRLNDSLSNGENWGKPAFSMLSSTGDINISMLRYIQIPAGATLKAIADRMFDTSALHD